MAADRAAAAPVVAEAAAAAKRFTDNKFDEPLRWLFSFVMKSFDVVVVGGGVMGLSCAWQLAQAGQKVLVIDQFPIPNEIGSSHGGSRITRTAYFEHSNYVPLLKQAHLFWNQLQSESGETLVDWVGGLYVGDPESEIITGTLESAVTHQLETHQYSAAELRKEFPQFKVPDHLIGVHEKDAGVLFPESCVQTLKSDSIRRRVAIVESERVNAINVDSNSVEIATDANIFFADHVVLATGAWANSWLEKYSAIEMKITKQVAVWLDVDEPEKYRNLPITCFQDRSEPFFYSFPLLAGESAIKMAIHDPGTEVSPYIPRESTTIEVEEVSKGFEKYYRGYRSISKTSTCLYTNSPDSHFIIDQLEPRVSVVTGCSGHGFKFAPVIGKIVTQAILGNPIPEASFLKLDRFKKI